jgi:hypothetical protein
MTREKNLYLARKNGIIKSDIPLHSSSWVLRLARLKKFSSGPSDENSLVLDDVLRNFVTLQY